MTNSENNVLIQRLLIKLIHETEHGNMLWTKKPTKLVNDYYFVKTLIKNIEYSFAVYKKSKPTSYCFELLQEGISCVVSAENLLKIKELHEVIIELEKGNVTMTATGERVVSEMLDGVGGNLFSYL